MSESHMGLASGILPTIGLINEQMRINAECNTSKGKVKLHISHQITVIG